VVRSGELAAPDRQNDIFGEPFQVIPIVINSLSQRCLLPEHFAANRFVLGLSGLQLSVKLEEETDPMNHFIETELTSVPPYVQLPVVQ
jgi:hypothetical protein